MENFREQTGVTFPIGWGANGTYSALFGIGGSGLSPFPLDVIIDRDGRIAYASREYEPDVLASFVEALLAQN